MQVQLMTVAAIAALLLPNSASAQGGKLRKKLPIQDDELTSLAESRQDSSNDGQHHKASECRFADKRYELEETWHPDLGPPFGIMYCVHCECVPIHKKRRIVGRVRCKNIKTECPKVNCSDPILLPGRCCKICPGETENLDLTIDVNLKREEDEKNGRNYASILRPTAGSSSSTSVATGRFIFRKKTLSYSFVTSEDFGWPKLITFLDNEGNIIEEFNWQQTTFMNTTGKVCGSWHRLPRRYRKQLRKDELYAQLTNKDGVNIAGRLGKFYGLSSEDFSALAVSTNGGNEVATAIVSATSQGGPGSLHVHLLMSGNFFNPENSGKGGSKVTVKFEWKNDSTGEMESTIEDFDVPKINPEVTALDFKTVFDAPVLDALGRGRLLLTITTKDPNPKSLEGLLAPKFSCDIFDSVLSASDVDGEEPNEAQGQPSHHARGLAWMLMGKTGLIRYHLRLSGLTSDIVSIQMDNAKISKRLFKVVQELLPSFSYDEPPTKPGYKSGWANGTLQMSAGDLENLYHSNLYITVATMNNERELRGRIISQLLTSAHEVADHPILVSAEDSRSTSTVSAIAWANVDSSCKLNYYLRLSSADKRGESKIYLKDYPMKNLKAMALVPIRTLEMQEFYGTEVSGQQDQIHKLSLVRLQSGDASLMVQHNGDSPYVIEGRIRGVQPPADCVPRFSRNYLEVMPGYLSDLGDDKPDIGPAYANKCVYEDNAYNNGDQWPSTHESCKMCACIKGSVECEPILCPKPNCTNPLVLEGECCPSCPMDIPAGSQQGCWFEGDKQVHAAGSKWHPYLPPRGFDRCVLCSCKADGLQVDCLRKSCPPLSCPAKQQVKADNRSCCKTCNESIPLENEDDEGTEEEQVVSDPDRPHDMGVEKTNADILESGGCQWREEVYPNGAVWHPRVLPYGRVSCVSCACKDGQPRCQKEPCAKLTCRYQIKDKDLCCPKCAHTPAEIKHAKKEERRLAVRKLKRSQRIRQQQEALHDSNGDEVKENLVD